MFILENPLAFVDVETTGTSSIHGQIIEIGILRVENNALVDSFATLVNPQRHVDPFILNMTGIDPDELAEAPIFNEIAERVISILNGCIFLAHNVNFDYGFFRQEFARIGINFKAKHICTAKIAKRLFPGHRHYNLDSIIDRFNIVCERRHRAFDDAKVLWDFWNKAQQLVGPERMNAEYLHLSKRPSVPIALTPDDLDALPESPGIYLFYGENDVLLYIGKSTNIKNRVLSHFHNPEGIDIKLAQLIRRIESKETAGELSALITESYLIKKLQPLYNRQLRNRQILQMALEGENADGYKTISLVLSDMVGIDDIPNIIGVYPSVKKAKSSLSSVIREHELCPKLSGLEKSTGQCFASQLGYCLGACGKKEDSFTYNQRFKQAFEPQKVKNWPFHSPILLKETGILEYGVIIDKWCLLGQIQSDEEIYEIINNQYRFDYDTYKILKAFILNRKHSNIRLSPITIQSISDI